MIIQNILLPYDGSTLSKKALELAKEITRNFNANLTILMVIPSYHLTSRLVSSDPMITNYRKLVKSLINEGRKDVSSVTEKCREQGVKASYKVVNDDISSAILKEAKKSKIDLIIMGSRRLKGMSSIKRLGSTARRVSESASCPVTLVH